jgi:flavin-dependent dehydrogenase
MRTVVEPSRTTPVYGEFDVVVVGGGPAGIMAAAAAARSGRSTILLERLTRPVGHNFQEVVPYGGGFGHNF